MNLTKISGYKRESETFPNYKRNISKLWEKHFQTEKIINLTKVSVYKREKHFQTAKRVNLTKISVWAVIQLGNSSTANFPQCHNPTYKSTQSGNRPCVWLTRKWRKNKRNPHFDYYLIYLTFFAPKNAKNKKIKNKK